MIAFISQSTTFHSLFQTYRKEILQNFKVCPNLDHCLSELEYNSQLAVAVSLEHAINTRRAYVYCFKKTDVIYKYTLKFLIRKDFPYLNELNWFIRKASEGGLIEKWRIDNNIQSQYKYNAKSNHMTFQNVYGFGCILSGCCILTVLCLFIERFIYKRVRSLNPSRIWLIIEMYIDPDRHFWLETKMI